MFSEAFRQRLALEEHTKWASDLTEEHLHALLWMAGEFFSRGDSVLRLLGSYLREPGLEPGLARSIAAILALNHAGFGLEPDRPEDQAIFSKEFRQELKQGKHTHWACDFSEAKLEGFLRAAGEFAAHAQPALEWLDQHSARAGDSYGFIRAQYGLEATARIVAGERYGVNEATRRVRERVALRDNPGLG